MNGSMSLGTLADTEPGGMRAFSLVVCRKFASFY